MCAADDKQQMVIRATVNTIVLNIMDIIKLLYHLITLSPVTIYYEGADENWT